MFLHKLGGIQGFRLLNCTGVRILMYHRFPANTQGLKRQCEIIRREYHPVSLRALSEYLRGGEPLPRNAVAITIDDGFRDFLFAHPVFRQHDIPVTVFLVSDFLDGKLWLWFNQIKYALRHTRKDSLTLELPQKESFAVSFAGDLERGIVHERISDRLKKLENTARLAACKQIIEQLEVEIPASPPEEFAPLKWSEVQELARDGVEFGAHTKSHPILSQLKDPATQKEEIEGSKRRLEEELGSPVIHFCYPNGKRTDFNDTTLKLVADCGFHSAVTTEPGLNLPGAPPFLLRRLGVEPSVPVPYFRELLAGVRKE